MLYSFTDLGLESPAILSVGFLMCSIVLITSVLAKANSFIFGSKDFDLLSSLPIDNKSIIMSKIFSFLIFTYLPLSIMYIPTIVTYAIVAKTTVLYWVFSLVFFIVFPFLIISILTFITFLFSYLFRNFKYKNLFSVIISLVLFIAIMVFTFSMNGSPEETGDMMMLLNNSLAYLYYPALLMVNGLTGSLSNSIIFILINIIPMLLFVLITSKTYVKLNSALVANRPKSTFNEQQITQKSSGTLFSLTKMEFKKFFSIPLGVINSSTGKLMMVILTIVLATNKSLVGIQEINMDIIFLILLISMMFTLGMTATTVTSVSLEGNRLWILKSLPVKTSDIFISKILVDYIISFVLILISLVVTFIFLKPSFFVGLLALVFMLVYGLLVSITGLLINLRFPKMVWELPVQVIKQSMGVLILMLFDLIVTLVSVGVFVLLSKLTQSLALVLLGEVIFITIILGISIIILKKKGPKLFNQIS